MKRIILLAVCAALTLGTAQASMAVRMEDSAALLREDGAEIVPEGTYADIVPLGLNLFAASSEGKRFALMDAEGALSSRELYEELRLREGTLMAQRGGAWGLLNRDGAELGAFVYGAILPSGDGRCWALREEDEMQAIWLLGADGSARDSGLRALRVGEPGDGLLPLCTEDGLWGCCDVAGRMAIPASFDWIGSFLDGRAPAVAEGHYGVIDVDGAWIVAPRYEYLELSPSGFLLADREDGAQMLNWNGELLADYAGEGLWVALVGAGYLVGDAASLRVFDAEGQLLERLAPDASVSEGVGEQLVLSEGMWGEACVRLSGTDKRYQNLYPLGTDGEGRAVYASLEVDAARYQNDLLHEVQVSVDMDSARYGLVDAAGEALVPCGYRSVDCLGPDRFLVRDESQWRVINAWGRIYWRSNDAMRIVAPNS